MNTERLREIEDQLADDVLTDEEMTAALHAAGLPEVARVLGKALPGRAIGAAFEADFLREQARNARTRMTDGDPGDGYNVETSLHVTAYDQGWRDALDSFARHLDRLADRFDPGARQPSGWFGPVRRAR
jgi:hypothetical protein